MKYIFILGISILTSIVILSMKTYAVVDPQNSSEWRQEVISTGLKYCDCGKEEETWPNKIIKKLAAYLPKEVINNMDKFESEKTSDGNLNYIWYRLKIDEPNAILHDIQLTATKKNNKLLFYHYKDYGYDEENLPFKNISKKCAYTLVKRFAKDFIPTSEKLNFINKPSYFSLYNPNHVESWVAEGEEFNYLIMINLDYGYVEYYRVEEKQPLYK